MNGDSEAGASTQGEPQSQASATKRASARLSKVATAHCAKVPSRRDFGGLEQGLRVRAGAAVGGCRGEMAALVAFHFALRVLLMMLLSRADTDETIHIKH